MTRLSEIQKLKAKSAIPTYLRSSWFEGEKENNEPPSIERDDDDVQGTVTFLVLLRFAIAKRKANASATKKAREGASK
jgi:hypothetical protein